ncbi:MAG TPA: 50S ribosomal protein L21 [Gaiellaceae bacterium]|nr:50S ribosomal protein L21 [Gaiellaceae bacterium]
MSGYAIISLGGKQYRVHEGEWLLVDRLKVEEGKTLQPRVLFVGGDGAPDLAPTATVTARVVGHEFGEKIRIGKYKKRTGYKRHNGYRSRLTRIEIESIGGKAEAAKPKAEKAKPKAEKTEPKPAAKAETAESGIDVGSMTIADITTAVAGWSKAEVEAALAAEQSGKARKGAITALESALEEKS